MAYKDKNLQLEYQKKWRESHKEYISEYAKSRRSEYRAKYGAKSAERLRKSRNENVRRINEIKATTPCADCGLYFDPVAMDFDHVKDVKYRNISAMTQCSWDKIKEEMDKCEIVCANCHRIRTRKRVAVVE